MATEFHIPRLAALIIAQDADATHLVLGRSLTELQVARVVSGGARHIICLIKQVSPQLLAVADNLRNNGLTVDIVRTIADAADAVHPEETVLLAASQVLISAKTLVELLASGTHSLLCVAKEAATTQFEIVDAEMRWTGYALLGGATLHRVAGMVGDWDAGSTLLRQLVQENARRIVIGHDQAIEALLQVRDKGEALHVGRKLLDDGVEHRGGFGAYWLCRPVGRFLARLAGELKFKSRIIELSALGAAVVATAAALTGWLAAGLLILLMVFSVRSAASRLASALGELAPLPRLLQWTIDAATVVVASSCAVTLASRTGQWGCLLLGGLLIGAQALISPRSADPIESQRWMADPFSGVAILLLGIAATLPVTGLFVAAAHAVGSYLWMQRVPPATVSERN